MTLKAVNDRWITLFKFINSLRNDGLTAPQKWLLALALLAFVATVGLCLYELRVDAKRFFALAKELEKAEEDRRWEENERYKSKRYWLIHASYVTLGVAICATSIYLVLTIVGI